ncbi:hypothetical protein DES53_1262 [Roseimicrobium gellanilyticum]|uniref:Preprotein translocase subunit SecD n=1 Tax=Roseimicrobium gellanilyticum TaxID=748857 RepID=A0A366H1M0_9BACT|nr:hypothetical protein [Roseimicrobium gellanilyticum]RBP35126.1 hypothetical protein DES53_1262 [Roseimicrobium gellanilyticum]
MRRLAPLLLLALAPFFMGMSKKPKYTITIHAQAEEMDVPQTMFPINIGGKQMLFKILPEFSQENVVAFHPFPADNGNGMGVALQLEVRGKGNLEIATRTRQGEFLLAMVNGKPVDYSQITRPVSDGIFTIWQGIPEEIVAEMDKKIRRIKAGGPPSMSKDMEFVPSTRKERKRAKQEADRLEKEAEKARKSGKPVEPEIPSLPAGNVSPQLPVEGGAPPGAPADASVPSQPAPPAPPPALPR